MSDRIVNYSKVYGRNCESVRVKIEILLDIVVLR